VASGKGAKCADTKDKMIERLRHRHGSCQYRGDGKLDKALSKKGCPGHEDEAEDEDAAEDGAKDDS